MRQHVVVHMLFCTCGSKVPEDSKVFGWLGSVSLSAMQRMRELIKKFPEGTLLFKGVTPVAPLAKLRKILGELNVPNAMAYRTHDLRRWHARDLQIDGACGLLLPVLSVQALLHVGQVRRCTRFSQQENGGPLPSWRCGLSLRVAGA